MTWSFQLPQTCAFWLRDHRIDTCFLTKGCTSFLGVACLLGYSPFKLLDELVKEYSLLFSPEGVVVRFSPMYSTRRCRFATLLWHVAVKMVGGRCRFCRSSPGGRFSCRRRFGVVVRVHVCLPENFPTPSFQICLLADAVSLAYGCFCASRSPFCCLFAFCNTPQDGPRMEL